MSIDRALIKRESERRRTFAIISHPDAGKTTLTEKILLYAGMIRTAGMVKGRKNRKGTSSDWMAMEQERGISISASAMQFEYKGRVINVLDTPGHQDFSEDTYRTLTAADSAVMVIDAGNGVETQTKKLFSVCRMRGVPILTFINKLDLPGREPLDLMAELEEVLGIQSTAINWPIGLGPEFCGVFDVLKERALLFERVGLGGSEKAKSESCTLQDLQARVPTHVYNQLLEELELLREAGNPFDREKFLAGELTPVLFGSALTNFGVEPFFDLFSELAPAPWAREAYVLEGALAGDDGLAAKDARTVLVDPVTEPFSGYVFKMQANLDRRHRDSMAFIRVCSGMFERDQTVVNKRLGKELRLSNSHAMFGGERTTLDHAFPGDIVGVVNPGNFRVGDTVAAAGDFIFKPMPKFPPEVVARIRPKDVMRKKAFDKAMQQFRDEGAVLVLERYGNMSGDPLIAAVGPLQFDVILFRLEDEYKVPSVLERLPYKYGSWVEGDPERFQLPTTSMLATDGYGRFIMLYGQEWEKQRAAELNPDHRLRDFVD
jgi:peptide chain release factor 3